jgi:hypothetical protein
MKLLTHNMLACHIRGVKNNFPFVIEAIKIENIDADYNPGKMDEYERYVQGFNSPRLVSP